MAAPVRHSVRSPARAVAKEWLPEALIPRTPPRAGQASKRTSEKARQAALEKKRQAFIRTSFWGVLLPLLVVAGFISALPHAWGFLHNPKVFPIKTLVLNGKLKYVQEDWLRHTVLAASAKGFFGLDVRSLREEICHRDWVAGCQVQKTWPDKVQVSLVEHKPLARWGDRQLVNEMGALFTLKSGPTPTELPRLDGPQGQVRRVLEKYQALSARLASEGLLLRALGMNDREAWQFVLGDGVIVHIGREAFDERVNRFVALYPRLKNDPKRALRYVDLRYDTGVAVGWKDEPKLQADTDARMASAFNPKG